MVTTDALHPGIYIRQECLVPHDLSVTDAAFVLGVSRQALSNLLGGRAGVSAEMAIRLSKAFGMPAELWMQRQLSYDLALATCQAPLIDVRPVAAKPAQTPQHELF
jgi:addiction module HigA family antidote